MRDSHGRKLADEWSSGAYAYKSVSVSGYPNLFLTFGPYSGPGHNSALLYMEAQIDYIVAAVRLIQQRGIRIFDVRKDRQDRYNARIQRRLTNTTWNSGCASWYLTEDGYNPTMYPGFATEFTLRAVPRGPRRLPGDRSRRVGTGSVRDPRSR